MKERITVTLDKELLNWLDFKVNDKTFANRSHGFEFLIKRKMLEENENPNCPKGQGIFNVVNTLNGGIKQRGDYSSFNKQRGVHNK
jgi:metal-responsive CopG/Arc/MetJ family transcriptional regulator